MISTPRSPYGNFLRFTNPPTFARNLVILAHEPVLGPDLGADPFELRSGHQYRGRLDR